MTLQEQSEAPGKVLFTIKLLPILDFGFWIDKPLQPGTLRVSICSLFKQKRLQLTIIRKSQH